MRPACVNMTEIKNKIGGTYMYTDENLIRLSCVSAEIEIACIVVFYCLSLKILVYKLQSRSQVYIKI